MTSETRIPGIRRSTLIAGIAATIAATLNDIVKHPQHNKK
jgi:hypothetical protein